MRVKVINLEHRIDRLQSITEQLIKFGYPEFERFNAFKKGIPGFNKSSHFVLENESEVLILEDDCVFEGTINDMMKAKQELPDDWDLLYLGANVRSEQTRYSDLLHNLKDGWTSHAILYSTKGADYCFNNFNWQESMIYDEWLRAHAQQHLRCFVMNPMIAFQSDGWSDIWGANTTYGIKDSQRNLI
jgi:GR25 family glycosyltransferase involved in LPS biosynthesis